MINLLKINQRKLRKYFLIRATFFLKPILFLLHFEIQKKTLYKNLWKAFFRLTRLTLTDVEVEQFRRSAFQIIAFFSDKNTYP